MLSIAFELVVPNAAIVGMAARSVHKMAGSRVQVNDFARIQLWRRTAVSG
jgi:hypothetical protein